MRDGFISWLLSGATGFFVSKGAEVMWPNASPWHWWSFGAALFVLMMLYSHRFWLKDRVYALAEGIASSRTEAPKKGTHTIHDFDKDNTDLLKRRQDVLLEIKAMTESLEDIAQRFSGPAAEQATFTSQDHLFVVLREKYSSWFPEEKQDNAQLIFWCQRIEAVLVAYDYPEAERIILEAAKKGGWH